MMYLYVKVRKKERIFKKEKRQINCVTFVGGLFKN